MPDENKTGEGFPDPSKNNEEVAQKLKDQDVHSQNNVDLKSPSDALDALV
jgi:hypothetical protein